MKRDVQICRLYKLHSLAQYISESIDRRVYGSCCYCVVTRREQLIVVILCILPYILHGNVSVYTNIYKTLLSRLFT